MKYKELVDKSEAELQKLLADTRAELQKVEFAVATGQEKGVRKIRVLRQTISQVLTCLNKTAK